VSWVTFSPDGRTLATCEWSGGNKVRLWDVGTGRQRHALAGHEMGCTCVAFSPDGKRLASCDAYYNRMGRYEGRLCLWDAAAGKLLREVRGTPGAIRQVVFTPDGRHVLAAADGVHVYEADTGRPAGEPFQTNRRVWGLALSADGRLLATADGNGPVRLWEPATHCEALLPGANGYGIALSPDGRTLAATTGPLSRKTAVLLDWPSGRTVGRVPGDIDLGSRPFFNPDGRRLATPADEESSVLLWDVAAVVNRPTPAVAKPAEADLRRWWG
jgi:WD40 repeat protein